MMRKRLLAALMILLAGCAAAFPAPAEKTVTMTFTGDVTLGSEEILRSWENSFDSVAAREGYGWFFRNMRELFSEDDLTLVNLEGALTDSPAMEDTGKTFRFRGPRDFAKILTVSSIEACAISNNHILDFGGQGYLNTREALEENGILYCGNEYSFIFEKDGIRIGFFALGNTFFEAYARKAAAEAARMRAEEGVDAIVFSFHAGQEYSTRHRDWDQDRRARIAIQEWGADLVIMHHPHVVQGVDRVRGRYVFYSLGNFCFGGNMQIRSLKNDPAVRALETMAVRIVMHFDDDGTYLGQEGRIYPCYTSSSAKQTGDPNDFQPKFVTGEEALGVIRRIQYDTGFDLGEPDPEKGYLELPYLPAGGEEKDAGK